MGDSSLGDDDITNSRAHFLHLEGNDAKGKGIKYLEGRDLRSRR